MIRELAAARGRPRASGRRCTRRRRGAPPARTRAPGASARRSRARLAARSARGRWPSSPRSSGARPSKGDIAPDLDAVAQARAYEAAGADADLGAHRAGPLRRLARRPARRGRGGRPARAAQGLHRRPLPDLGGGRRGRRRRPAHRRGPAGDRLARPARRVPATAASTPWSRSTTSTRRSAPGRAGATLVGVNNRDLRTLEVDLADQRAPGPRAGRCVLLVSESGIRDAGRRPRRWRWPGRAALLVGEALVRRRRGAARRHRAACEAAAGWAGDDARQDLRPHPRRGRARAPSSCGAWALRLRAHARARGTSTAATRGRARRRAAGDASRSASSTTEPPDWIAGAVAAAGLDAVQLSGGARRPLRGRRAGRGRASCGLRPLVIAAADTPDAARRRPRPARRPRSRRATAAPAARSTGGARRRRRTPRERLVLAGGLAPGQRRRRRSPPSARTPSTSRSGVERRPGRQGRRALLRAFFAAVAGTPTCRGGAAAMTHRDPLRPLRRAASSPRRSSRRSTSSTAAYEEARADPAFQAELARLLADYAGRPTPLYHAAAAQRALRRHASCSSARTSATPAPTRSTTSSVRCCSPSAWASRASSPRPAPGSTAWPPPPPARCSASSATSTWAREDVRAAGAQRRAHAPARRDRGPRRRAARARSRTR